MRLKTLRLVPGCICAGVLVLVGVLQVLPGRIPSFDFFKRLEWITYDWRVRQAFSQNDATGTTLGAVMIDEESLDFINRRFGVQWPWPRWYYGRLIRQLNAQGAKAIGFDILFAELHPDLPSTRQKLDEIATVSSDEYFARQLHTSSNAVLAVFSETFGQRWQAVPPARLFRTNAWTLAQVTSDRDSDGVLRRAKAFQDDRELGRLWHMGIVLAARELNLDLSKAIVEPARIVLRGAGGVERVIPVDADGYFYINWTLAWNDPRIVKGSFAQVAGLKPTDGEPPNWRGKLVMVGSVGTGNNISDLGATSLGKETYLVSKHWNVAYSVLTGRFIRVGPPWLELALIIVLGILSALLTWNLRAPWPTLAIAATIAAYAVLGWWLFVGFRFWLPMVLPILGALLLNHMALMTHQVLFEQQEKRKVKNLFARLVSPNVVNELLKVETINLGGTRKTITVMFADVRGFTEFTDLTQAQAEEQVRERGLSGEAAAQYFNEQAQMTLDTVNSYLSVVADCVKRHDGTLDKYVGDCVMAFWGAPTPNDQHAASCVRAAIDVQRSIHILNLERSTENLQRARQQSSRLAAGQPPLPLLPLLELGTGINSGLAIVGLMGSEVHQQNYTVFGREVNLASRLEHESGRSRIFIGETTYAEIKRDAPDLAATCIEIPPLMVKGFRTAVKVYEVPWREETPPPARSARS